PSGRPGTSGGRPLSAEPINRPPALGRPAGPPRRDRAGRPSTTKGYPRPTADDNLWLPTTASPLNLVTPAQADAPEGGAPPTLAGASAEMPRETRPALVPRPAAGITPGRPVAPADEAASSRRPGSGAAGEDPRREEARLAGQPATDPDAEERLWEVLDIPSAPSGRSAVPAEVVLAGSGVATHR
ncbi:MAG: hypothetical protein ACQSGP_31380, partial [Frankia sp.]